MQSSIKFVLDGKLIDLDFRDSGGPKPTTSVLNYLRSLPDHVGVKEGCSEGDCGACTVALGEIGPDGNMHYKYANSCLLFLPMIHGRQLITVENLKNSKGELHPVQKALLESYGSQCGYCTPGIIMSLFALYKNIQNPARAQIENFLEGNLCRCTGYRPIMEAAEVSCRDKRPDHFTLNEPHIIELLRKIPQQSVLIQTEKQRYFRPVSLAEAISLKHQHVAAELIAGATDTALRVTKRHELIPEIIDLSGVDDLKEINETEDRLSIGAGLVLNELIPRLKGKYEALSEMLSVFGSGQIRNQSTLGGNLGTASPIGDTIPVLIAYGAKVVLESINGRREIPMDEYLLAYRKTARKADEIIVSVDLPKLPQGITLRSYKVSKRKSVDISTVSAGFRLQLDGKNKVSGVTLAYGGMAEKVRRANTTEQFLTGKSWTRENVQEAMSLVSKDFSPISDVRGSAEYRAVVAKNLILKFWAETAIT